MMKRNTNNSNKPKEKVTKVEINWFPGHMTKTRRQIQANLKLVDAVAEIIDARIPISSRNPDINSIIQSKPRIILLNKCDMADPTKTSQWVEYYKRKNIVALPIDCKTGKGLDKFVPTVKKILSDKIKKWEEKGMKNHDIKVMVVGIPNVGKSSFINKMVKKSRAKVEDRPGVTRGSQWFSIDKNFELLDTPGVLWPKFEDKDVAEHLAFTGAIKDQVLDIESLAINLLEVLKKDYLESLISRYKLQDIDFNTIQNYELLEKIAFIRGMLISGGEADTERAAIMLLDEFRSSKIGKITLECVNGDMDERTK